MECSFLVFSLLWYVSNKKDYNDTIAIQLEPGFAIVYAWSRERENYTLCLNAEWLAGWVKKKNCGKRSK